MMKTFEDFTYGFADAQRMDSITEFLKNVNEDPEYDIEDPDIDELLDPYDGYNDQTYIQNKGKGVFIYYEGWSSLCWNALYLKPEYKGLSKIQALDKFLSERAPVIAKEVNCTIIKSGYDWFVSEWKEDAEDGYIMYIKMKIGI